MANPVPTSLALTTIAGNVSASPLNSDYTAIQTAVNALITATGGGAVNQVLQAVDSTHVQWAYPPGYEFANGNLSNAAQQAISLTGTEGAPTDITSLAFTFSGSDAIVIEGVVTMQWTSGFAVGDLLGLSLWDGGTDLGRLWAEQAQQTATSTTKAGLYFRSGKITPSAATHTYKLRGWGSGAGVRTAFYQDGAAGSGGAAHNPALTFRAIKV